MRLIKSVTSLSVSFCLFLASAAFSAPVVSISKSVDNYSPKVLDSFRYYVTVDSSVGTATAVSVTDVVPAGLSVTSISNGGTLSGGTITWNLGSLSCVPQTVTMTVFGDTAGGWTSFSQVGASDDVWATSTVGGPISANTNWFLVNPLTGYAVNSVTSVKVYYEYHNDTAADTVTTKFNNNGDLSTSQGSTTLSAGDGVATDAVQVWDISALGGGWTLNKLQHLAVYMEHDNGGGAGGHNAYIDKIWVVVSFQSCGISVYFDALVTNALSGGSVLSNSATMSGSNFSSINSVAVTSTVRGPLIALTKTAQPATVAVGDTVIYTINYKNQIAGTSIFDDFNNNYGTGGVGTIAAPLGVIPNWASDQQNTSWSNTGGVFAFAPCGYSRVWRTDVAPMSDQTVAVDFLVGAGTEAASIMFLNQVMSGNPGNFYKSKIYLSGDGYYHTDVQTSAWNQVCGNALIPGSNTAAWKLAWHTIQVVVKNYVFYVYVDGGLVFTCDDPTDFITSPGVPGMFNDGSCSSYDNFRIGDDMPAYNVVVKDTLDPCMGYISSVPAATVAGNLLTWNIGDLQGGQQGSVTFKAVVNSCSGSVPNFGNSTSSNTQPSSSANAPITVVMPIAKSVSPGTAQPLDTVTYSMVYTATGGGPIISDSFGTAWGGRWITETNQSPANWAITGGILDVNGNITDQFAAVGSSGVDGLLRSDIYIGEGQDNGLMFGYQGGKYYYVAFNCGFNANDDNLRLYYYDGTTSILKQQIGPIQIDPTNGSAGTGNAASMITASVVRAGNQFRVSVGGTYLGTLVDSSNALPGPGLQGYREAGGDWRFDNFYWEPGYKAGISIFDTVPANLSFVSACCGGTLSGGMVSWNLPDMSAGQKATVSFLVKVSSTASGVISNTAKSQAMGGPVYLSTVPLVVSSANISLLKSVSKTAYSVGETVTYCIAWSSTGSSPANVQIWDTLSPVLSYIGSSNAGSLQVVGGTNIVVWNLGSQAPGASGTVCVWATLAAYPLNPFESPRTLWAWIRQRFEALGRPT
jgi:uncharacterized repeat protein (TIGR01451 family)